MLQSVSRITVTEQHFLKGSGFSTLIVHNSQLGVHQSNGKLVLLNSIPLNEEVRFQWFARSPITGTSVYCTAGCLVSISHYRIQQYFTFSLPTRSQFSSKAQRWSVPSPLRWLNSHILVQAQEMFQSMCTLNTHLQDESNSSVSSAAKVVL